MQERWPLIWFLITVIYSMDVLEEKNAFFSMLEQIQKIKEKYMD